MKKIEFGGYRYYLNANGYLGRIEMLHHAEWIFHNGGPAPKSHVIHHHVDGALSNLQCMTREDHSSLHNKGKKRSEEHSRNLSKALKGREMPPLSEEHKRKISEAGKGRIVTEETKRKIGEANKNPSDETRKRISESAKNRPKRECVCQHCGKTYMSVYPMRAKYCSQDCNNRAYRKREKLK